METDYPIRMNEYEQSAARRREETRILATCINILRKSPSAHIIAEIRRRVERRARETRRDAQLPDAACAKRGDQ
eukprot:4007475-Pleurochrysis_carterae.AAC.1